MKLPLGSDVKANRKILKPQMERRRRERINRSLENLKTLLLQPQEETPRRVEKAEILEHTVSFLRKNTATRVHAGTGGGGSFHDGFSSCLRRAVDFLGPDQEKGLRLRAALDASLSARFTRTLASPVGSVDKRTGTPPPRAALPLTHSSRSFLWKLLHSRAAHGLHTAAHSAPRCPPTAPLQTHAAASRVGKQSASPVGQSLWRPWP